MGETTPTENSLLEGLGGSPIISSGAVGTSTPEIEVLKNQQQKETGLNLN